MALSDISKSTTKYTVVKGNTFSDIAARCISVGMPGYAGLSLYNDGINKLKSFNPDIENVNLIYAGQTIVLQGTAATKTVTKAQRAKITAFGLQSNTKSTVYATWSWDRDHTEEYKVMWKYGTGDGVGWVLEETTTKYKYSVCPSVPENATHVTFEVKPISKTYGEKETRYWTASWSTKKTYWFKNNAPEVPPIPDKAENSKDDGIWVDTEKSKVTIKLNLTDKYNDLGKLYLNAHEVEFQILKNDASAYSTGRAKITNKGFATYSCTLTAGDEYRVRCRSYRGATTTGTKYSSTQGVYSEWSGYSEIFGTAPTVSKGIHTKYFWRNTSGEYVVRLEWHSVGTNKKYVVGYTTEKEYFTSNPNGITKVSDIENNYVDIPIGDIGKEYFFAVQVGNTWGSSSWSEITSLKIGTKPGSPETWSNKTVAMTDDQIILYWVHSTTDNSPESFACIDLRVNGVKVTINENGEYITNTGNNYITVEKQKDEDGQVTSSVSSYALPIPGDYFTEGAVIEWAVSTAGIYEDEEGDLVYSDWSTYRKIDVYAPPSVSFSATTPITSNGVTRDVSIGITEETDDEGTLMETPLLYFPIKITARSESNPDFQTPTGYYIEVMSIGEYETTDNIGNVKMVQAGEVIFSKHYDTNEISITDEINANHIHLENNQTYRLSCILSMNSGLTAENHIDFLVAWTDEENWPNAEITYNPESYTATVKPYCEDLSGGLVFDVTLSVYRREFDGSFTELDPGVNNEDEAHIVDPHPSLDYARYRIVAVSNSTGAVSFYDVPGFPIQEKAVIIQWDEKWTNFEVTENEEPTVTPWAGSLLRLPYNIDVSDDYSPDVEFVNYIGREHPVSYYGTQKGHTATWSVNIPKSDAETLYALRRLSNWMGDVYVREPSGSGYWAHVTVSFSQKYNDLIIPVTFSITRVEGE